MTTVPKSYIGTYILLTNHGKLQFTSQNHDQKYTKRSLYPKILICIYIYIYLNIACAGSNIIAKNLKFLRYGSNVCLFRYSRFILSRNSLQSSLLLMKALKVKFDLRSRLSLDFYVFCEDGETVSSLWSEIINLSSS